MQQICLLKSFKFWIIYTLSQSLKVIYLYNCLINLVISFVDFSELMILKDEFFGLMQTTYSTPSFDVYVAETLTNRWLIFSYSISHLGFRLKIFNQRPALEILLIMKVIYFLVKFNSEWNIQRNFSCILLQSMPPFVQMD